MIYLASPLFSESERNYIDKIVHKISKELNLDELEDFYVPHRDNTYEYSEAQIYDTNIKNLENCDTMIAFLDGKDVDSGTAFEIGYFEAQDKIVLGLLTDKRSYENNDAELNSKLNTMIFGSLDYANLIFNDVDDLIGELYEILIDNDTIVFD